MAAPTATSKGLCQGAEHYPYNRNRQYATKTIYMSDSGEFLAAVVRNERDLICDAIGNELDRLSKEDGVIKNKLKRLWEVRAEILRDKETHLA